jgi:hemerythrin
MNQARVSRAFTGCVDVDSTPRTEDSFIEGELQHLSEAVLNGARLDDVCEIVASAEDFCVVFFALEEQMLSDRGFGNLEEHIAAHRQFIELLHAAQVAVGSGCVEATLDLGDLLCAVDEHIKQADNPELARAIRQRGYRQAAAIH